MQVSSMLFRVGASAVVLCGALGTANAQVTLDELDAFGPPVLLVPGTGLNGAFECYDGPAGHLDAALAAGNAICARAWSAVVNIINFTEPGDAVVNNDPLDVFAVSGSIAGSNDPLAGVADVPGSAGPFLASRNNFIASFTGYLNIKTAGLYGFRLGHDDGARLTIGGFDVIDSPALTAFANHFGAVDFLDPGLYAIRIDFQEATGDANLVLSFEPPGGGGYVVVPTADLYPVAQVAIDIKPGSDPNCFNVNGHGVIPVAILGSAGFDATTIDDSSLNFGGFAVRMRGNKGPLCSVEDVNGDGYDDLVCQFEDDASADWDPNDDATASLRGETIYGLEFIGTDTICVRPE